MIELKNVCKIYKSQKSNNTTALKNISLKFDEQGMTFILGKSGSGKSTLLNIIGGLDKYNSGEIIINGKSTVNFKESDFDAFRNTYMGFVFQEYNLLEDYSVEQNIKLSLELQNKSISNAEIKKVLKNVELEDISKRKPNELSGGQKQRVAIARALIKNPEIILADEPTGNLDSQTSEQIWNILKKLSKTKLVIVVSHDSESAKKYGDRIIEIKDGNIISDTNSNIEIKENYNEFDLKKAKLPFFYSFKIGVGSLIHKKARLVITTILMVFSLLCFGIMLSGYSIDFNEECLKLFKKNGENIVSISQYNDVVVYLEKNKIMTGGGFIDFEEFYEKYNPIEMDETLVNEIEKNTNLSWYKEYTIDVDSGKATMTYITNTIEFEDETPVYYSIGNSLAAFTFVEVDDLKIDNLIGKMPTNSDEIVISSYIADNFIYKGVMIQNNTGEFKEYYPSSYEELINSNKYINICDTTYAKVVGIIDYTNELSEYEFLKDISYADYWNEAIGKNYTEYSKTYTNLYSLIADTSLKIYVDSSFIEEQKNINIDRIHLYSVLTKVSTVSQMKTILSYYPIDNSNILSTCTYSEEVLNTVQFSSVINSIAKYGVIFFLIFAGLILMSFINTSVKFRKKEIGTLRALGCRSKDVITMFIYESLILMIISLIMSFILLPILISIVNNYIYILSDTSISILNFGLKQIIEITGIMFIIVILGNLIPVRKVTKMKPIDAILNK